MYHDTGKTDSLYPKSLFDYVGTDPKISAYLTVSGSASYVKKEIENYYNGIPSVGNRNEPDVPAAASPVSSADNYNLPGQVPHNVESDHSNGISGGSSGSSGSSGGSSGSSGLSALTVAFLGAVTFAAAFCRRP
jgi:hypothetical protein